MNIRIPTGALRIINRLEESGNSAYVVGGAVRDSIMGRKADDFDITTSMKPSDMKLLFSDLRTVDTGIRHGTLTVLADGGQFEVTTYRIDGEYTDSRHPSSVSFTDRIEDDLARRDFTVNAIAYSPSRGICDPFGGISDINAGIIRAVGEPERRFGEDALRIMRAVRFSSTLGFDIEENTKSAIYKKLSLLENVSRERIFVEWKKLLSGKNAYPVLNKYKEIIHFIIPELSGFSLGERAAFDALIPTEKMLYLHFDKGYQGLLSALDSLKADNALKKFGKDTLAVTDSLRAFDEMSLAGCYAKYSKEAISSAIRIAKARDSYDSLALAYIDKLLKSNLPSSLPELAIDGKDIMAMGFSGERVGKALNEVLIAVIRGVVPNEREALISYTHTKDFCI